MSLRNWWRRKSGKSKAVTVVATLMILQIGLCFGTPEGVSWYRALFHLKPSDDPFEALGMMAFQAMLCVVTGLVLVLIAILWESKTPKPEKENHYE